MGSNEEDWTDEQRHDMELIVSFLHHVAEDPFARRALADALFAGQLPISDDGAVQFTLEGLQWMEERENYLRERASN